MLGQREGAYSTPGVESGLGSEGPEPVGLQCWANGRPRKVDRAKLPATGSRRGAWPLVKKKREACSASQWEAREGGACATGGQ